MSKSSRQPWNERNESGSNTLINSGSNSNLKLASYAYWPKAFVSLPFGHSNSLFRETKWSRSVLIQTSTKQRLTCLLFLQALKRNLSIQKVNRQMCLSSSNRESTLLKNLSLKLLKNSTSSIWRRVTCLTSSSLQRVLDFTNQSKAQFLKISFLQRINWETQ